MVCVAAVAVVVAVATAAAGWRQARWVGWTRVVVVVVIELFLELFVGAVVVEEVGDDHARSRSTTHDGERILARDGGQRRTSSIVRFKGAYE